MILIAIGANLPADDGATPLESCERAVAALAVLPGLRVVARSAWHKTPPDPPSDQPNYINGMVRLEGTVDCVTLLGALHAIEAAAGRRRTVVNAARPLDLDIIELNGLVRRAPDPVLPHPRAHLRSFVLLPLREVAPDWVHPVLHRSAADLLRDLA